MTATPTDAESLATELAVDKRMFPRGDYGQQVRHVAAAKLRTQEAELNTLRAESHELTKALTGLTCGGSEFFNRRGERYTADIEACVAYVRRRDTAAHDRTVRAIKRALSAETALKEALGLLGRFVDELGCTIERFHKIGPDFTFRDGTQVFDVGVVLDREDLIEEARALTLKQSDQGQEQGSDLSKPTGLSGSLTPNDGWQDIATAPKDGVTFLVAGNWPDGTPWLNFGYRAAAGYIYGDWQDDLEPTHWRPLLAPDQGTTIQPSVSAAALKAEISRLLDWNGPIMSAWDAARADLLNGDEGSGPRDIMEAAFDAFHELPERLSSQADRIGEGS